MNLIIQWLNNVICLCPFTYQSYLILQLLRHFFLKLWSYDHVADDLSKQKQEGGILTHIIITYMRGIMQVPVP